MRSAKSPSRRRLGLFGAFGALVLTATATAMGTNSAVFAAAANSGTASTGKADYSLLASPESQSVQRGKSVVYTLTTTAVNGYSSPVDLSLSGLPAGATGVFSPSPQVSFTGGSKQTTSLTVTAGRSTPVDVTSTLTITGTSRITKTAVVKLTVERTPGSLALSTTTASVTAVPGASTAYSLGITRTGSTVGVPVSLSAEGLPASVASLAFSPTAPVGDLVSVNLAVDQAAAAGSYPFRVTGTAGSENAAIGLTLVVDPTLRRPFLISSVAPSRLLAPGVSVPLDLVLENPSSKQLTVTDITVVANTDGTTQCGSDNFRVTQLAKYPLTLPGGVTRSLSQLGVVSADLPHLTMRNLPVNQNACKKQTVTLTYSGSAQGN